MDTIESLYKEWQSLQPIKPEYQNRLDQKFMLEFNYNSNHIEGNTLTYGQTEMLLLFGKAIDDASMKDLEDMKASNVGLKMTKEAALDKDKPLTEYFIRNLHQTLLREDYTVYKQLPDGTETSYTIHAGQYKTRPNSVITPTGERFEYASPEETPALMNDLIQWYNQVEAEGSMTPIELASLFHYRYIRIHPFEDCNGRISRLIVNYILYRHGYPMLVVKTDDKKNYLTALNRCDVVVGPVPSEGANATLPQITPFVEYMTKCLANALTLCIKAAKGESITEADDWRKKLKLNYYDQLNRPELTDELGRKIREDFTSLYKYIDDELAEFSPIFDSLYWTHNDVDEREKAYDGNIHYHYTMHFHKEFDNWKEGSSITLQLTIQRYLYKIEVFGGDKNIPINNRHFLWKKKFNNSEVITDNDKSDIVNAFGNNLYRILEYWTKKRE